MNPGTGVKELILDRDDFEQQASQMLRDLATATGTPPEALKRPAAESLVVLRIAGELVLPALRTAAADSDRPCLNDLIDGPIRDLVDVAGCGSLSASTLWGNVASVIESSARIIAAEQPELGSRASDIATQTLRLEPLAGCWTGAVGAGFRRTSCCLVVGPTSDPDPDELRCGDCVRRVSAS